jgi:hypothetical protein
MVASLSAFRAWSPIDPRGTTMPVSSNKEQTPEKRQDRGNRQDRQPLKHQQENSDCGHKPGQRNLLQRARPASVIDNSEAGRYQFC